MTDADELARRYFALWAEYLTGLVADPQVAEMLRRWIVLTGQFTKGAGESAGTPFAAWPPTVAAASASGSAAAAAAAAGASGERGDAMGELTRRLGELERRLAAVEKRPEPKPAARRARRRDRASGQ